MLKAACGLLSHDAMPSRRDSGERRKPGRPVGTFGPVALALLEAAEAGPADVRTLAMRARVGFAVARYSASRLLAAGRLTADRTRRPWVLRVPQADSPGGEVEAARLLYAWMHAR